MAVDGWMEVEEEDERFSEKTCSAVTGQTTSIRGNLQYLTRVREMLCLLSHEKYLSATSQVKSNKSVGTIAGKV